MLREGYNYFIRPTGDSEHELSYKAVVLKRLFSQDMEVFIEVIATNNMPREFWDNVESREQHYRCFRFTNGADEDVEAHSDLIIWLPKSVAVDLRELSVYVLRYYPESESLQFIANRAFGFQISEYEDLNIIIDLEERKDEYPDDVE